MSLSSVGRADTSGQVEGRPSQTFPRNANEDKVHDCTNVTYVRVYFTLTIIFVYKYIFFQTSCFITNCRVYFFFFFLRFSHNILRRSRTPVNKTRARPVHCRAAGWTTDGRGVYRRVANRPPACPVRTLPYAVSKRNCYWLFLFISNPLPLPKKKMKSDVCSNKSDLPSGNGRAIGSVASIRVKILECRLHL